MSDAPPTESPLLEIACFNAESALLAAAAGADRIEYVFVRSISRRNM
jgi:copper homeostasis protein CutC